MSFVIGFATTDAAIIISDGRCTDRSGRIITEHYNKTRRINNNVIIGFSGETILCEKAISSLNTPTSILAVSCPSINNYTVEDVSNNICNYLKYLHLPATRNCSFIVAGFNKSKCIELATFGIANGLNIRRLIPSTENLQYITLSPEGVNGNRIVYRQLTEVRHRSIDDALKDAISEVALISRSVNSNYYSELISRPERLFYL